MIDYQEFIIARRVERAGKIMFELPTLNADPELGVRGATSAFRSGVSVDLTKARKEADLTRKETAKKIGTDELYVMCIEQDLRYPPTADEIEQYGLPRPNFNTQLELTDAMANLFNMNK